MPFVTEEIYHQLNERKEGDDITIKTRSKWEWEFKTIHIVARKIIKRGNYSFA
jgi:hypothetical protein